MVGMVNKMSRTNIRTYSELIVQPTFKERFDYLQLNGKVAEETFGFDRRINQYFYQRSDEWKSVRDYVIVRDNGCDLAIEGYDIYKNIIVHHMNPVTVEDIKLNSEYLLDPEFLICTSLNTHNAIHYGNSDLLYLSLTERSEFDTCPWKRK